MHWSKQTLSSNNTKEDSIPGHHQMVNIKIRLIIFFAAKDGEALNSQTELTWTEPNGLPTNWGSEIPKSWRCSSNKWNREKKKKPVFHSSDTLYSLPSVNIPLIVECVVILSDHLYKLPATLQSGRDGPHDLVWKWKFREASPRLQSQQGASSSWMLSEREGGMGKERKKHLLWFTPWSPPPPIAPVFTQEPLKDQSHSDKILDQKPETTAVEGLPSGWDSTLPMQGVWVPSLVRELDPTCCI